jgi:hypothetical protein
LERFDGRILLSSPKLERSSADQVIDFVFPRVEVSSSRSEQHKTAQPFPAIDSCIELLTVQLVPRRMPGSSLNESHLITLHISYLEVGP